MKSLMRRAATLLAVFADSDWTPALLAEVPEILREQLCAFQRVEKLAEEWAAIGGAPHGAFAYALRDALEGK